MKTLDCRALACPAPVLRTKEAIEEGHPKTIQITVDNEAAKENVSRFLGTQGYDVALDQDGEDYQILGKKGVGAVIDDTPLERAQTAEQKIMVMIATDRVGRGDDELGDSLMVNFIKTLKEMGEELWRLVFVNNGVKLTIDGAKVLSDLKELEDSGVSILVCGTCLGHFNLIDKKRVGETTNMLDIVTAMQLADKVINI